MDTDQPSSPPAKAPLPSYDEVVALPRAKRMVIPAEMGDANGHLNVRHYLALHDDAGWDYFAGLGFDPAYIATRRRNFFDLEHHLRYLDEVLVGDTVSVHYRALGRTAKAAHLMSFLVNDSRRVLANTFEVLTVHVDLETRRTVPIDEDNARLIDARIAADAEIPWLAPVSGALGLRRG